MIEVLQSAEIMRYLVLTKQDQFLLKTQRSKVIDSSEDNYYKMVTTDQKEVVSQSYNLEDQFENINNFLTQEGDKRMNERQKIDLRKLLHHYQNKPINKQ